jgi:hypothetical protein
VARGVPRSPRDTAACQLYARVRRHPDPARSHGFVRYDETHGPLASGSQTPLELAPSPRLAYVQPQNGSTRLARFPAVAGYGL